jgi:hypothetical protein
LLGAGKAAGKTLQRRMRQSAVASWYTLYVRDA